MYDTGTDSSSSVWNIREDRGATWRATIAANGLADLVGYTITLKLGDAAEVALPVSGNSFTFELSAAVTATMAAHTPYIIYWTTPAGYKDALFRGTITLI